MSPVMIILNVVFVAAVVAVIVGGLLYAVATQHRDHGVEAHGSLLRRRIWSSRHAVASRRPATRRAPAPEMAFGHANAHPRSTTAS